MQIRIWNSLVECSLETTPVRYGLEILILGQILALISRFLVIQFYADYVENSLHVQCPTLAAVLHTALSNFKFLALHLCRRLLELKLVFLA